MMKKIITLVLALAMAVSLFTGCGKKNAAENGETDSDKLKIVTTIFPEYDWVKEILGDKAESTDLTMLLDNGVDLHSYQPTADDIIKISDCDLFIYVGGESDKWVDDALKEATNKDMKVIDLLEVLGDSVKTEETVEGMQETEHAHDHSKEVSTFEDDEVQDRSLSDWAGDWQSAYPFALDGTLDVTLSLTCDTMPLLAQVPMQLTLAEGTSSVQCVLEALLALEGENGLENSIPQGTKILSLKLAGGVCTLDLTAEFLEGCRTAEQERMAVREIVASLSALPEVETIDLLVEGLEPNYRDDSLQTVHTARNYWFVS